MEPHRSPSPVFYPEFETMSETTHHQRICETGKQLVRRHLAQRGEVAFTGSDQFVYWVEGDPGTRVSPDLYVAWGHAPDFSPGSWKVWELGPLRFVIEVVSTVYKKDDEGAPVRYAAMGVEELVVFDPTPGRRRIRWQRFRLSDGELLRVDAHDGPRIWSDVLECWLCYAVAADGDCRIRLATGPHAEHQVLTDEEIVVARTRELERSQRDVHALHAQLQDREAQLQDKDAQLQEAEAELARLRAQMKGSDPSE